MLTGFTPAALLMGIQAVFLSQAAQREGLGLAAFATTLVGVAAGLALEPPETTRGVGYLQVRLCTVRWRQCTISL